MKIPLQLKIAELEARIVALEKQLAQVQRVTVTHKLVNDEMFGAKWRALWASFDDLMKSVFSGNVRTNS